ncbi:hypothetical protein [Bacillus sp. FJAT-29937]|uniref:hypothetical protein n=1 Tax=Bacillus sp. FJAT-29937 TaxID=1720553 RepID=UPI000831B904|nr:hypothetical protein [Bacillus sp. FJAT-29937]
MSKKRATEPKKAGDKQMLYLNDNQAVLDFINKQSNVSDGVRLAILFFLEHVGNVDSQMYFPPYFHNGGNVTSFVRSLIDNGSIKPPETSLLSSSPIMTKTTSSISNEEHLINEIKQIKSTLSQLQVENTPQIHETIEKPTINTIENKARKDQEIVEIPKEEYREPSIAKESKVDLNESIKQPMVTINDDSEDEPPVPDFLLDRLK